MKCKLHVFLTALKHRWTRLVSALRYRPPRRPMYYREYLLEPHRPSRWLVAVVVFLALGVTIQRLTHFNQVQVDPYLTQPFQAYNNQVVKTGDLQILAKTFWWEYLPESTGRTEHPEQTAALHLTTSHADLQIRVAAGQVVTVEGIHLKVLTVDADLSGPFVRLQIQP